MNLNNLAKTITQKEGGTVSLGIGQVKEVMRLTLTELARMPEEEARNVLARYRKRAINDMARAAAGVGAEYANVKTTTNAAATATRKLAGAHTSAARRAKR